MQIKKIILYNVPYTEDDHHQPLKGGAPQHEGTDSEGKPIIVPCDPIITLDNISAKPIDFGKSIDVSSSYDIIRNANYGAFEILFESSTKPITYYAWIDSITTTSLLQGGCTHITYHWDYWRTFKNNIKILRGTLINKPISTDAPPQFPPSIRETFGNVVHEIHYQDNNIAWVFLVVVANAGSAGIERYAFPVYRTKYGDNFRFMDKYGNAKNFPSLLDVINGSLLLTMRIPKEKIIGCSIGSIAPIEYKLEGTNKDIIVFSYDEGTGEYTCPTYDIVTEYNGDSGDIFTADGKLDFNIFNPHGEDIQELLKWTCFPDSKKGFIRTSGIHEIHIFLEVPSTQYFPLLQRLKFYSTIWNKFNEINFDGQPVYYGDYYWRKDGTTTITYTQVFDVDTSKRITKIKRIFSDDSERFDIEFSDKTTLQNKGINNILALRPNDITFKYTDLYNTDFTTREFSNEGKTFTLLNSPSGVWPILSKSVITIKDKEGKEKPAPLIKSTPTAKIFLTDNYGYPVNCFQQKHEIVSYSTQCISQNNQMSVLISFNSDYGFIDNNEFCINLTPIDMAQEYFNEYIVSLEREATNAKRTENIIASLTDMAGTAAIGTMLAGPGGGVLGAGGSLAKTIMGGALTTGVLGSILGEYHQRELENRIKKQGSLLLRSGNDYSWTKIGYNISLIATKFDKYSAQNFTRNSIEYGYNCNEFYDGVDNFTDILNKQGPLRMSAVTLKEGIPNEANIYIRKKLMDGIYLDPGL